jgi:hypothetical protein
MSGGFFDYDQYKIGKIADQIESLIETNGDGSKNEWGETIGRNYSERTVEKFKVALYYLGLAQVFAHRIDWLVSDDDGEESFHRRLAEEVSAFQAKYDCRPLGE